tara:strand:+ start:1001 stop:4711 length:3711 start_codon:yes stop_codon:yes gene_type:complete
MKIFFSFMVIFLKYKISLNLGKILRFNSIKWPFFLLLLGVFPALSGPLVEDSSDEESQHSSLHGEMDVSYSKDRKVDDKHNYTLLLLDPTLVHNFDKRGEEFYWPFLNHKIKKTNLNIKGSIDSDNKGHIAIRYWQPFRESHAETLINFLTATQQREVPHSERPPVFVAGAILFKRNIAGRDYYPTLVLGQSWLSLINPDSIVRDFGLHLCISAGVLFDIKNQGAEVEKIKEITLEELRLDNPEKIKRKTLKSYKKFSDYGLEAGEVRISQIRIQPLRKWGRSLITGADWLKFREEVDESDPILALQKKIREFCDIFSAFSMDTIYDLLKEYVDVPVNQELAKKLDEEISKNWGKHCEGGSIFPHDKYWFRIRREGEREEIYNYISPGIKAIDLNETKIQGYSLKFLIRSLPIGMEGRYHWYDSGYWYEISDIRTKAMCRELERWHVDYKKALLLPPADWASLKKETEEDKATDYKEQYYNKMALRDINEVLQRSSKPPSWIRMLDRTSTTLKEGGKFEFADLVMKRGEEYYLLHVKRAKTGSAEFGHLCTQIERCVEYLSGNLDRTELFYPFIIAEWGFPNDDFLESYKVKKGIARKYRDLKIFNTASTDQKKIDEFVDHMRVERKSKSKHFIDSILSRIEYDKVDFKFWMETQQPFFFCLDHLQAREDDKRPFTQDFLKKYFDKAKNGVEKASFFIKDTLLEKKKKRHIHVVAAIIEDKPFKLKKEEESAKEFYDTNKILRMYQSLRNALGKHFKFAWTTITMKGEEFYGSFWEYPYQVEDVQNILSLRAGADSCSDKLTESAINGGNKVIYDEESGVYVLMPQSDNGTPQKRVGLLLKWLVSKKKVDSKKPFKVLVPYLTQKGHWVSGHLQFDPISKIVAVNILSSQEIEEKKIAKEVLDGNINALMKGYIKDGKLKYQLNKEIDEQLKKLYGEGFKVEFRAHETYLKTPRVNGGLFVLRLINNFLSSGIADSLAKDYEEGDVKKDRLGQFESLIKEGKNLARVFKKEEDRVSPILKNEESTNEEREDSEEESSSPPGRASFTGVSDDDNEEEDDDIIKAKKESLKEAEEKEKIGPKRLPKFNILDVKGDGNCFYYAVCDQLERLGHKFISNVTRGTEPSDSLRLKIQGRKFKDKEWAGQQEMINFAQEFKDVILCFIDTRYPDAGFAAFFYNEKTKKVEEYNPKEERPLPIDKKIVRLAFTGNHYMSVLEQPALGNGVLKNEFSFSSDDESE